MKELILVRHAKSDWENVSLNDVDRYLSERGYSDAYLMSEWFASKQKIPDRIYSSTATRALSTALIFARKLELIQTHFVLENKIYEASSQTLISLIQQLPDELQSVMFFGHNPGFTDLSNELCGQLKLDNMPTCGMVSINFEAKNWKSIKIGAGIYNYHQFPKGFKN